MSAQYPLMKHIQLSLRDIYDPVKVAKETKSLDNWDQLINKINKTLDAQSLSILIYFKTYAIEYWLAVILISLFPYFNDGKT